MSELGLGGAVMVWCVCTDDKNGHVDIEQIDNT